MRRGRGRGGRRPPRPAPALTVTVALDDTLRAVVDEQFICANLDFWPPEKCDFGICGAWSNASALVIDLKVRSWVRSWVR